ncbi:alpha/beta fold hydrolase [Rothia sp. ZJ1223]|uniref:alpha/beta fold hydrolase n=1 Tax=Rothia sp. ZJ1223 TaxID=2811098 RepID=UPI001959B99A|nr:alpha/beta hydrolase [Rothia sp. ZJ1223]MBM7050964.1 alpha/beta hydrolase [Rothia sp. ZJ1223]
MESQVFEPVGEYVATVVAVHGFGGSVQQSWVKTGWVKTLTQAGFRVWAVTLPLHSVEDDAEVEPGEMPKDINIMVQHLNSEIYQLAQPVVGLGFSLGGRLIWELATDASSPLAAATIIGMGAHNHLDIAAHELVSSDPAPGHDERLFDQVLAHTRVPRPALLTFARALSNPLTSFQARVPVLLLHGEHDALAAGAQQLVDATLAAGYSARLEVVAGRDHISVLTSGKARATARDFLRQELTSTLEVEVKSQHGLR